MKLSFGADLLLNRQLVIVAVVTIDIYIFLNSSTHSSTIVKSVCVYCRHFNPYLIFLINNFVKVGMCTLGVPSFIMISMVVGWVVGSTLFNWDIKVVV